MLLPPSPLLLLLRHPQVPHSHHQHRNPHSLLLLLSLNPCHAPHRFRCAGRTQKQQRRRQQQQQELGLHGCALLQSWRLGLWLFVAAAEVH
jgi:hypothetical protein